MASTDREIRNDRNMIIGWCKEYPDRIVGVHYKKGYVGCYTKSSNITTDLRGKIFCYGDGVSDLIRRADREG